MNISHAYLVAANVRPVGKEDLLNRCQPTLQLRQRSWLQALQELRLRDDRENGGAILGELLVVDRLGRQKRHDRLERLVAPCLECLVRFACHYLVFPAQLVDDHVDDGRRVGVDIATDGEEGNATVRNVERFEVGTRENDGLRELRVVEAGGSEKEMDLLAVRGGGVGE